MGLLDQIIGGLVNNQGGGSSPLQSIIGQLMGGQQSGQQQAPWGGAGSGNAEGGSAAGLMGLVQQLQQAGLGNIVQSWIGNGSNQAVSPQQLHSALGDDQVQGMANQAGMAPGDLLAQLSHLLPRVVDGLTPNGKLPEGGNPGGNPGGTTWV
jgi:uncharacterized protein YidB (DUF937 family)